VIRQGPESLLESLNDPTGLLPSDRDFLRRLDQLARRRAVTRAARDLAMANLQAPADAEEALAYLGLDVDELRREP
jgi:hypothetical protein